MRTQRALLERILLLGFAASQATACDALVGLGPPLRPSPSDASGAAPSGAPADDAKRLGLVRINGTSTGVLLAPDLVVTCGHCMHYGPYQNGANSVVVPGADGCISYSDQVYWFGVGAGNNPDLALLHLSPPISGVEPGGTDVPLDDIPSAQRVGTSLVGYEWADAGAALWWTGGARGVAASLYVLAAEPPPAPWHDDPGAPYFIESGDGGAVLVALQTDGLTDAGTARTAVALGDMAAWIAAVRTMDWNAGLSAERVPVSWDEVATSYWSFTDAAAVTWAWAMRTATWFTFARAFPAGFFTGEQSDAGVVMECEGPGTVFVDAVDADIATTPEPFTDVNAVPWAQAYRDAAFLCRKAGYPGGHFDGNQVTTDGITHYGLICTNGNAVTGSVAAADLVDAGIANVDVMDWTAAARAGDRLCRSEGFVSGFLTGETDSDAGTAGVLCEK